MLKYIIIQLDDLAVPFCHYSCDKKNSRLIPIETLDMAILWSMKENLNVQFLYPRHALPAQYKEAIKKTFHADIVPWNCEDLELLNQADVVVFDSWSAASFYNFRAEQSYVIHTSIDNFCEQTATLSAILPKLKRLNIALTDIESFSKEKESEYATALNILCQKVLKEYKAGHNVQINILTDRMFLEKMNNCNAGEESITLCPDGKFYVCPAFYTDECEAVGDINSGLKIKNQQLYKLDHAPICRLCDAYHCRRCVWLNKKTTLEVNTPSHEQCIIAHIERNASKKLLDGMRMINPDFMADNNIPSIDYIDPFDKLFTKQQ